MNEHTIDFDLYPQVLLDYLKQKVIKQDYKTKKDLPKFIFLCGKDLEKGVNRKNIQKFYEVNRKDVISFNCEDIYKKDNKLDLLTFEKQIAYLSDGIIVVLESFGTAAELGAFSLEDSLVNKLIVFVDKKFENSNSFICLGPLKKIRKVIYTDVLDDVIFSNSKAICELKSFSVNKKCVNNKVNDNICIKSFIIELLDIISILGPVKESQIIPIYKYIKDFNTYKIKDIEKGEELQIKMSDLYMLLLSSNVLINHNSYLSVNRNVYKKNSFLFNFSGFEVENIRAKFLARKYKYCVQSVL